MDRDNINMDNKITTANLKHVLESKGVKPSFQRISVLKYIMEQKNHPSVDTIYSNLIEQIPTLSRTTIYNTLNLLTEKEIITALTISDTELRYDYADVDTQHAHFQCNNCGDIFDLDIVCETCKSESIGGHKIIEKQIHLKGICAKCLKQ